MNHLLYKRIVLFCIFIISINTGKAQVSKSEYFMRTSFMRTYLNPAMRPDQGQLIIPILPNIGANIQTNSLNLDHLTFNRGGEKVTFLHPLVSDHDFLKGLGNDNYVRADVNYKIFAMSMFLKGRYTSFDIGFRAHADVNIPKSAFELLKVGFDQDKSSAYDLSDISATASTFVEIGVSQSRPFLDKTLMVGARVKFLVGGGYLDLNAKSLEVEADPTQWRALSQVTLKGAAPGVVPKYNSKGQLDGFDFGWKGIPGYGAGIDIGAVYDVRKILPVLDGLKVSGALNDIGFISWSKKNSLSLYSPETEVIVSPSDYIQGKADGNSISKVLEDAFNDLKEAVNLKEGEKASSGRTTSLRMTMHLATEYELIKHKLSVGALYSTLFGNYYTSHEMTLSGNYQPFYWLATTLSYSFVHSDFDTFGFALHLAPRKGITFFVASDYIIPHVSTQFLPTSSKGLNLQLGFSIPLGPVTTAKF